MPRPSVHRYFISRAGGLLLAAVLSPLGMATELGDVAVRSHIGQQLSADIELVMLGADEVDGVPVRLASANVYQGANIKMPPALSSLRLSVVKRDGRQFLHLTTSQPVEAELLHLFLELGTGGKAAVRLATLWLTPAPALALAPVPVPVPARPMAPTRPPVVVVVPPVAPPPVVVVPPVTSAPAPLAAGVQERAPALAGAAVQAAPLGASKSLPPVAPAAPVRERLSVPAVTGAAPVRASHTALAAATARAESTMQRAAPPAARKPAACRAAGPGEDAKQCIALDARNEELAEKIVDLESKVKQLQAALGGAASASATPAGAEGAAPAKQAASAPAPAAAAGPVPASTSAPAPAAAPAPVQSAASAPPQNKPGTIIPPSKPGAKKEKRSGVNQTTVIVASSLLGLGVLGGLILFLRKRKVRFSTDKLKVWRGWRKKQPAEAPTPIEPALEQAP